jgi:hypothetical protein
MAEAQRSTLTVRMIRAAQLDVTLFEEVEADETATGQAALVVLLVGMIGGFACALGQMEGHPHGSPIGAPIGMIVGGIAALVGWWIWAMLTYWIGTRLFGGTATPGEMLRTLGFAQSPGLLTILAFIPLLHWPIHAVAWLWVLVAGVVAVRQALDFTTEKAILTVVIGWLVQIAFWIALVVFVLAAIVAVVAGAMAIGGAAR